MNCRGCQNPDTTPVLDVGLVPAADHFPPVGSPVTRSEAANPLAMAMCSRCGLAQLMDDDTVTDEPRGVEPEALRDQAAAAIADVAGDGWLAGTTVAEFGSPHGGTWLPLMSARGFTPRGGGGGTVDTVLDCFGIMHEPDQRAAFARRAALTAPTGTLLLQFHSLTAIVEQRQWNALRHGHFAYYSLTALVRLLGDQGMSVVTAWEYDLYGGTVLLAAVHGDHPGDHRVTAILRREAGRGVTEPAYAARLQQAVDDQWTALREWLQAESITGRRIYAYGAASRAVALFAGAGIASELLHGVADASPAKQRRRMPGTDIPIISPDDLVAARPHAVLVTVPDLVDEVARRYPELAPVLCTAPPARFSASAGTPGRHRHPAGQEIQA